jgi:hypothetical protein
LAAAIPESAQTCGRTSQSNLRLIYRNAPACMCSPSPRLFVSGGSQRGNGASVHDAANGASRVTDTAIADEPFNPSARRRLAAQGHTLRVHPSDVRSGWIELGWIGLDWIASRKGSPLRISAMDSRRLRRRERTAEKRTTAEIHRGTLTRQRVVSDDCVLVHTLGAAGARMLAYVPYGRCFEFVQDLASPIELH